MIFEKQQVMANSGFFFRFQIILHRIFQYQVMKSYCHGLKGQICSHVFSKLLKGCGFKSCCDHLVLCSCDPIKTWSNDSDEFIRRPNYNFSLTYTPDIVARIHDHNYSLTYHVKQLLLITYPVVQNKNLKPLVTCFVSVAQR